MKGIDVYVEEAPRNRGVSILRVSGYVDTTTSPDLERRLQAEYRRRYGHDPLEDSQEFRDAPFNRLSVMWTIAGWL